MDHNVSGDPDGKIRTQDIDALWNGWDGSRLYTHNNLFLFSGELHICHPYHL